ncbi:MAG: outer membrane beta-barrel protein [Candidatus Kapaibacterium sp.]
MKNVLLFVSLMIFASVHIFTQEDVLRPKKPQHIQQDVNLDANYKIRYGIEVGINYNLYSSDQRWLPIVDQSLLNVYGKAEGISPYFVAMLDFPINSKFGIQTRLSYEGRGFSNEYDGIADCYIADDFQIVDAEVRINSKFSGADIGFSALLRYNVTDEIEIALGPMLLIPSADYEIEETQTVLSEECFFNYDTDPTKQISSTSKIGINTRFGIDLGFSYNIPLSDAVTLAPSLRLNYMFNKLFDDMAGIDVTRESLYGSAFYELVDAKLNVLKFGFALWF